MKIHNGPHLNGKGIDLRSGTVDRGTHEAINTHLSRHSAKKSKRQATGHFRKLSGAAFEAGVFLIPIQYFAGYFARVLVFRG